MTRSEWKTRLAVWSGAIAIAAVSFGLVLWVAAWLPAVLFAWWLHLSPRTRAMAGPIPFFVVSIASLVIGYGLGWRRLRTQRPNTPRPRPAN